MNSLIDRPLLISSAELENMLNPEALETKWGSRLANTWLVKKRGSVAILPIHGAISRFDSYMNWIRGGTATEDIARDFAAAQDDYGIKAIILDFDTPGGDARAIHECAEMIRNSKKPVFAYVGGQCASGGIWLASACDEIVTDKIAEMGSLGVVFGYQQTGSKTIEIVSSNAPKKRLSPDSEEGRMEIQQRADDLEAVFISKVAEYRGLKEEQVKSDFGQGGMMIAEKAIKAGMADRFGSLEGLIEELQAKHSSNGVSTMGLKTDLRALVSGKEDSEIEAAFAALGFFPKTEGDAPDIDNIKAESLATGKEEGEASAKTAEAERVAAVMEKAQIARVSNPKFIAELLTLSPEDAGQKILDAQADASASQEIFSTVNPMSNGGGNALVEDAKKRAEA